MKKFNLILILILSASIITCGSSSSDDNGTTGGGDDISGDGSSLTVPSGVTYSVDGKSEEFLFTFSDSTELANYSTCLNVCVANPPTQDSTIEEYMDYMECLMGCFDEFSNMPQGAFAIRIVFTNTTGGSVDITIPAGSLFDPADDGTQPQMTIDDIIITVPDGGTTEIIPTFCLAPHKSAPGDSDTYTYQGIATKTCLVTILGILDSKNIDIFTFSDIMDVQSAVWNCVEDEFGPTDIAILNALP